MIYLKHFNYDDDYWAFRESEEFILPNVSYAVDTDTVYYNPLVTIPELTFPIYLELGEQGQLGVDVFTYLTLKYGQDAPQNGESVVEELFIDNKPVNSWGYFANETSFSFYDGSGYNYIVESDGNVKKVGIPM